MYSICDDFLSIASYYEKLLTPWQIDEETHKKDNYIKRIVEEHGYRFWDGNVCADEIGLDYEVDFYNKRHANAIGACKFTKFLGQYIREHYNLLEKHSPKVVESWERAASENRKRYKESVAIIMEKVEEQRNNKIAH